MANLPISGLTASVANLAGTDVLPVVQTTGVGPVKMSGLQLAGGLLGSTALTGATITANAPVLDLAQTWNNAAVTFTGAKFNVTDTASNAASLLMDLQVGGTSRFSVAKDGNVRLVTSAGVASHGISGTNGFSITANAGTSGSALWSLNNGATTQRSDAQFGWSSTTNTSLARDLTILRRGAANLQLGAADVDGSPVAQTLSVQSTTATTTTNNVAGANLTIQGSRGTGNAAGGSIVFQVAPAGSSGTAQNALAAALTINADRSLSVATTMTIGDSSGTVGRLNIGVGPSQGLFFGNRGSIGAQADGVFLLRDNATTSFGRLQFGGTTSSFPSIKRSSTSLIVRLADDSANAPLESASVKTDAPAGGTSGTWKLGVAATVSPTSPNRTIEVDIGGTIYYIAAKTTND
jgi:hypothetical protein